MNQAEVNQLLSRVDKEHLTRSIEDRKLFCNIMEKRVPCPKVLHYVEARVSGKKPVPLVRRCSCKSSKVKTISVSQEEMEKLWVK